MSWKSEVVADSTGNWVSNQLRFTTEEEARNYVTNLSGRWSAVRQTRVLESDEPVNSQWTGTSHGFFTGKPPLPRATEDMTVEPITDAAGVEKLIADLLGRSE